MADRYPLVVDSSNYRVEELPAGDSLDFNGSSVKNVTVVGVSTFSNATNSTNSSTGAVLVTGGVGIGSTLAVEGGIYVGAADDQFFISRGLRVGNGLSQFRGASGSNIHIGDPYVGIGTTGYGGFRNVAIGRSALTMYSNGLQNVAVGYAALGKNKDGSGCVAIGVETLAEQLHGIENVAIGNAAMRSCTGGIGLAGAQGRDNTALGHASMIGLTTGSQNTAVGHNSLQNIAGGINNTVVGREAGKLAVDSNSNNYFGWNCGHSNVSGNQNTAMGNGALFTNDASQNTAIGFQAGYFLTTGIRNTALGWNSLYGTNMTGSNNTGIGASAGANLSTGSNNTCIGTGALVSIGTTSNQVVLGDSNVTNLRCNVTSISAISDERDKTNIVDLPIGLDFINALRPVKFEWDRRDGSMVGIQEAGFIAQELDAAQGAAGAEEYLRLVLKANPEQLEAAPGKLIPVLVKAIQELKAEVDALKNA